MLTFRSVVLAWAQICVLAAAGCTQNPPAIDARNKSGDVQQTEFEAVADLPEEERPTVFPEPKKLTVVHLPNAIQIHQKVISGGQPDGEAAFQELKELGVRTIVSVDGALPDVDLARKHGMKYVHLPHSYDGIPELRVRELAKVVRDLDGPIYIHCHHGKHRSPAAAAVACVAAGLIDQSMALTVLNTAGTSENYRGLYQSAESARKLDQAILDAVHSDFPAVASLPPMAEAMVNLEHTHDRLNKVESADWKSPSDHPDLDPAHEALLLKEHFTEMLRAETATGRSETFLEMLRDSESAGAELEAALRQWKVGGLRLPVPEEIVESFDRISRNCSECHRESRDVPLSEKQQ